MSELEIGKRYYLIGPDGKRTLNKFELLELDAQGRTRVKASNGTKFRVHRNRIVLEKEQDMQVAAKPEAPKVVKPETPKVVKPEAPKVTKAEAPKVVKSEVPAFDVVGFVAGRECWKREGVKFDHAQYRLDVLCVIDETLGRCIFVNTYRYPDGTISLGRNNAGITEYPLKGHKVTYTVSQKAARVEARGTKKQRKGTKTAEEIRADLAKKGYEKI